MSKRTKGRVAVKL